MKEHGIPDILLAVEWGASIDGVASAYVEAFNKSGAYIILNYKVRAPRPDEVKIAEKDVDEVRIVEGKFQTVKKMFDGTEVKKELFVMVLDKTQKMPPHIVKMRMEAEKQRIKNGE